MGELILEKDIPGSNGRAMGKLGFDMDCDGTREYVEKMFKKSKIDQVLDFYGIPYIYKNEYKKYLKYRIQDRHCQIVHDYFLQVLRQDGYDIDDFDFGKLQREYIERVPNAEQTGLDLHTNYQDFLKRDLDHRKAISKENDSTKDETILNMQKMMMDMMEEMKQLKSQVGNNDVLLSNESNDTRSNGKGSELDTTNNNGTSIGNQEITMEETGEAGLTPIDGTKDEGTEGGIQQIG